MEHFYDRLHLSLQITKGFYGIDFEADEPRMNVEGLTVMMAELQLESNWIKLKTITRHIFIPANRGETSFLNENKNLPANRGARLTGL